MRPAFDSFEAVWDRMKACWMRWTYDLFDDPANSRVIHSNPNESAGMHIINIFPALNSYYFISILNTVLQKFYT